MSDREALLRTIFENPDDDAPRLVYADWLEEHGDSQQAAFIRLQIDLARRPPETPDAEDPRVKEVVSLWGVRKRWRYLSPQWTAGYLHGYRRGFAARWLGSPRELLNALPGLWREGPPEGGYLFTRDANDIRLTAKALPRLAARPELGSFRDLDLSGDWVDATALGCLLNSPHLGKLQTLQLHGELLDDHAARAVAISSAGKVLRKLRWLSTRLTPAGQAMLEQAFGDRVAFS